MIIACHLTLRYLYIGLNPHSDLLGSGVCYAIIVFHKIRPNWEERNCPMSDAETKTWEEENGNLIQEDAISDALSFLDEMDSVDEQPYDEEAQSALSVEQGPEDEYVPANDQISESLTEELPVADDNFGADEEFSNSYAVEEPVAETSEAVETVDAAESEFVEEAELADETSLQESSDDAFPSFEEEETVDEVAVAAPEPVPEPAPVSQATDDFNLATLNQLVEEIRQESQRVADMKASVARALALIQEMSESLKS